VLIFYGKDSVSQPSKQIFGKKLNLFALEIPAEVLLCIFAEQNG
jgi:hypothetical protein